MEKIEKLEIPDTNAVIGLADRDGKEIEIKAIGRKINEIIDYLNQSQKQPEEKCIHYFPLSSEGVCQKCGIKFEDIKSEKQEEWRKEWRKLSFEIGSITKHQADEIEDFISKLLSERTFNKEELKVIEEWYDGMLYPTSPDERDKLVHDKLSKLLKEEE